MQWDLDILDWVYDKAGGHCRYCGKKLSWVNYGTPNGRGAWEVDHSVPVALGGTHYLSNLWPSCIECNREKGTMTGPQYMRLFQEPRRLSSQGDGIWTVLAGAFLLYLFFRALSQRRSDGQ